MSEMEAIIVEGEAFESLERLPADSFDSIVTDPPSGISFMGAEWDGFKGYAPKSPRGVAVLEGGRLLGLESWEAGFIAFLADIMGEALKALKPGGYAAVWALPRTSDLTALALRVAGFEVRESFHHVFSSGFPKSHDVAKAVDAHLGVDSVVTQAAVGEPVPGAVYGDSLNVKFGQRNRYDYQTDQAKKWAGFGTATKPAHEVWWIARRPLIGTVAKNVLAHGTGALNIDACRIGETERFNPLKGKASAGWGHSANGAEGGTTVKGRWPTNLAFGHDERCEEGKPCVEGCVAAEIDKQSGFSSSSPTYEGKPRESKATNFAMKTSMPSFYEDEGGASRFFPCFYTPKPASGEKATGLEGANVHPTVKSIALMRWLARLITPPKGRILDTFAGSGSTGVAAALEGFGFLGIERDPVFADIARRRIGHAIRNPSGLSMGQARVRTDDDDQLGFAFPE